jgi:hypothetical protein
METIRYNWRYKWQLSNPLTEFTQTDSGLPEGGKCKLQK